MKGLLNGAPVNRAAQHQTIAYFPPPTAAQALLQELLASSLVLPDEWERLPAPAQQGLQACRDKAGLLALLVEHGLLTEYQAARIDAGTIFGLVLGNYRILDKIGAGGMGIVFKGEHVDMRRLVAIKVLPPSLDKDPRVLARFLAEMRTVAQLHHPNIVAAIDAGKTDNDDPDAPTLRYFVMEYVPGQDLEDYVSTRGPLLPAKACDLVYQVASALAETHKHNLVHRDLKPSNILVTPEEQAKLLDFGLTRHFGNRMTEPGAVLGTIEYMAPEQARDASTVDIRADIYGLGCTLFWCLTGRTPFPPQGKIFEDLARRLTQLPPSVRTFRPEVSPELDALVARMMAVNPDDRYPTPQAVMNALLGFLKVESHEPILLPSPVKGAGQGVTSLTNPGGNNRLHRVLVVDDSAMKRQFCACTLQEEGIPCDEVEDGFQALEAIGSKAYDLVLTDWLMPGMTGLELCRKLRESPPSPNLKIILFSSEVTDDEVAKVLEAGADDYLSKQFSAVQLVARVKAAIRFKEAQDRADLLNRHLLTCNAQLEHNLTASDSDLVQVRNALVLGLADLVCHRDIEPVSHVLRLQSYCRCLAEEAAHLPGYAEQIDTNFIQMLECCAPLHDIGKAGLPDHILGKSSPLDPEERLMMQAHTGLGAETLQKVAQRHGEAVAFLQMAIDIARHHHERYDGKGYPDRLAGTDIPLAARIVTVGDVYDGLRSRRVYKPALTHASALEMMLEKSSGQFDPVLLQAFRLAAPKFERIFQETPG